MNTLGLAMPLDELLRPQQGGEVVNPHVLSPAVDLHPDYDAMRRALSGIDAHTLMIEPDKSR